MKKVWFTAATTDFFGWRRKIINSCIFSITKLRKRLFAGFIAVTSVFLFIAVKTFTVSVIKGEAYREKAIDQWTRELPVKAVRGDIYDCNGILLAGSGGTFCVYARTRSVKAPDGVSRVLAEKLKIDGEALRKKLEKGGSGEITVKRQVPREVVTELSEEKLDGIYFAPDSSRVYPYGSMLCQTLGYTSVDGSGQAGIEKYYDEYLSGTDGEILYESDIAGTDVKNAKPHYLPAKNGYDLRINVDYEIQLICENEIKKTVDKYSPRRASVIVLRPGDGAVLALCGYPSFDLNEVPREDKELLSFNGRNALVCDSYEPGSTFKVVTASANIEETLNGNKNAFPLTYIYNSSRYRVVSGRKIKCWSTHANGKHSNENLAMALNNSCNPVFVDIALALGKNTMYKYIKNYNFGATTGIDIGGEALGMLVPESAVTDGDIARIGFGQTIAVTPLQLACAVSAAVNGGVYYQPRILSEVTADGKTLSVNHAVAKNRVISEKASRIIASYLEGVVSEGSGKQAYIAGYKVGGKTGTAQKFENGTLAQGKYVMSFVGFFPADNPQYLALVTVDEPIGGTYGSTVAAPVCKNVFEGIINVKDIKPFEAIENNNARTDN